MMIFYVGSSVTYIITNADGFSLFFSYGTPGDWL